MTYRVFNRSLGHNTFFQVNMYGSEDPSSDE